MNNLTKCSSLITKNYILFSKCTASGSLTWKVNGQNELSSRRFQSSVASSSFFTSYNNFFRAISESKAVESTKGLLVTVHDSCGLPWWATIVISTVVLRTCLTLPLAIYQTKMIAKIENISMIEMPEIAKEVKAETERKAREFMWDQQKASFQYRRSIKKEWDALIVRDNCHPFKSAITLWVQIPMWVCLSSALRNIAYMLPHKDLTALQLYTQMGTEGFLWIPNLTIGDGTLILPVVLGLSNLAIIEIQALMRLKEPSRFQRIITNFFRGFSVLLIPISATVPSGVCLYWTVSSLVGLSHNLLIISKTVRNICGVPDTPTTPDHPYLHLIAHLKQKFSFSKKTAKG